MNTELQNFEASGSQVEIWLVSSLIDFSDTPYTLLQQAVLSATEPEVASCNCSTAFLSVEVCVD